jgi:hypothetical protein
MFDFGAIVNAAKDVLMPAAEEVTAEATEEVSALTDEFGLDEFGTEGLW